MITNPDICIRLRVLNPQRQFLEGTVDLEFKQVSSGQTMVVAGADASKEIDVRGLQRSPQGLYQVTVIPTDTAQPVSQFVNVPPRGFATVEIVIDKRGGTQNGDGYRVTGTVRDKLQRPLPGVVVRVTDKDIRSEQPLGQAVVTDASGAYQVSYTEKEFASTDLLAPDIVVRVFGPNEQLLKESEVFYNAPPQLRVDLNLSDQDYPGPSEFEQTAKTIAPFLGKLPPSELTENQKDQDITFLTNKTGLPREHVEA